MDRIDCVFGFGRTPARSLMLSDSKRTRVLVILVVVSWLFRIGIVCFRVFKLS